MMSSRRIWKYHIICLSPEVKLVRDYIYPCKRDICFLWYHELRSGSGQWSVFLQPPEPQLLMYHRTRLSTVLSYRRSVSVCSRSRRSLLRIQKPWMWIQTTISVTNTFSESIYIKLKLMDVRSSDTLGEKVFGEQKIPSTFSFYGSSRKFWFLRKPITKLLRTTLILPRGIR